MRARTGRHPGHTIDVNRNLADVKSLQPTSILDDASQLSAAHDVLAVVLELREFLLPWLPGVAVLPKQPSKFFLLLSLSL